MFAIETGTDDDGVVLTVTGEVDMATADELRQRGLDAIAGADGASVVIDAAAVTFIDSSGLGALVVLNRAIVERNGSSGCRTGAALRVAAQRRAECV